MASLRLFGTCTGSCSCACKLLFELLRFGRQPVDLHAAGCHVVPRNRDLLRTLEPVRFLAQASDAAPSQETPRRHSKPLPSGRARPARPPHFDDATPNAFSLLSSCCELLGRASQGCFRLKQLVPAPLQLALYAGDERLSLLEGVLETGSPLSELVALCFDLRERPLDSLHTREFPAQPIIHLGRL